MSELTGKVAVITGGTRGLGLAIAQAYAAAGALVVVASRSAQSVEAVVSQLTATGAKATGVALDVSDMAAMEALAEHAVRTFGRIDVWVNNAGTTGPFGPTVGYSPHAFDQVVQTNVIGVYHGSYVALRRFLPQKSGKLINVLGHGYKKPVPYQNAYGASKAWVLSFTMALAAEHKESGVGVYAFNPGMVLTDLLTDVDVMTGFEDQLKVFPTIVRMWGKPPVVPAAKAVWLASAATDGKTGLLVNVFTTWVMLSGVLGEGVRRLFRRPAPATDVRIRSIPYQPGNA